MENTQVTNICKKCGKAFKVKAYRADTAHYCSKACWSTRNPSTPRQCEHCGKTFNSEDKTARFCSRSCGRKSLVGTKATAWKGGKAAHRTRSKYKGDLAKWREAVFQRDGYTCQDCGKKGGDIQAHHVLPLSEHPEVATDVTNGRTLCVACHEAIHRRKFSAPSKYPKHCTDCEAPTSGRSLYCRPCSIKHMHERAGHKPTKTCPQCGVQFTGRREQIYCSTSCGVKANHARSKRTGVFPVA